MKKTCSILFLIVVSFSLRAQELQPVTNLRYEVTGSNKARFYWDLPENYVPQIQELSWSDCEYHSLIGAATHINWPCAHRFDAFDLRYYSGWRITDIGFMPTQDRTYYSIRIWKGEEEPELCYDSPVGADTTLFQMNYYPVTENVFIEEGKQLWVGFNAIDSLGRWPWAVDDGPAVVGKGDLIWMAGGFESIGYPYNFIIKAHIESMEGERKVIEWESQYNENEVLTGYNLYVNGYLVETIEGEIPMYYDLTCIPDWNNLEFTVRAVYGEQESEPISINTTWPDDDRWYWKVITQPDGYDIDADGNITISTAEGLAWLISVVNGLNCQHASTFATKTISITNDIDMSDGIWTPIDYPDSFGSIYFRPSFQGNEFTISGLHGSNCFIKNFQGTLKNLVFENCEFIDTEGGNPIGGIICHASLTQTGYTVIDNCHVRNTTVQSAGDCGGIVGTIKECIIRNCSFTDGTVATGRSVCGGLIGKNNSWSRIENSYFVGNIMDLSGNATVLGGIIGYSDSHEIKNCYAVLMESNVPEKVAGIVSDIRTAGTISNCYSLYPQVICLDSIATVQNCSVFDGSGTSWILQESVMVGDQQTDDLLTALDNWVTSQNVENRYYEWEKDTEMTNHGFPIFGDKYVDVKEMSSDCESILYPNPISGLLTITINDFHKAMVYDLTGRLLKQSQQPILDLHALPQGLYVVKVFDKTGNSIIRKIIKQ